MSASGEPSAEEAKASPLASGEPSESQPSAEEAKASPLQHDLQEHQQWLSATASNNGMSQPILPPQSVRELKSGSEWSRQQFIQYHLNKMQHYLMLAHEAIDYFGATSHADVQGVLERIQDHRDRIVDDAGKYTIDPVDREAVYLLKKAKEPFDWSRFAR